MKDKIVVTKQKKTKNRKVNDIAINNYDDDIFLLNHRNFMRNVLRMRARKETLTQTCAMVGRLKTGKIVKNVLNEEKSNEEYK